MEYTAELRDYYSYPAGNSSVYVGRIYNDSKGRFVDGQIVRTSLVEKVDGDLVYTMNSVYKLVNE